MIFPDRAAPEPALSNLVWSEHGSGEVVVLLHSGGMNARQWRSTVQALSSKYRVIAPDFLGYGKTGPWPEASPFHYAYDVDATLRLIASIGGRAHLVGHSYGGLIAAQVALRSPESVSTLTLCEPVAFGVLRSENDTEGLADLPSWEPTLQLDTPEQREVWLEVFVDYWSGRGAWSRLGESTRQSFRDVAHKLYGEVMSLMDDPTSAAEYEKINVPTLLVAGENTTLAARRVIALLGQHIANVRTESIAGAGHMAPITHASVVNALLVEHIGSAR